MVKAQVDDYVVTDRGNIVENRYAVHAAIVDAKGTLLYAVGDPARITLARSAAKPAQALAILETGCFDRFNFDEADLALMCASHSSEDRHIERAREMLAKVGVKEDVLRCGGHPALSNDVNRAWIKADFVPTAVHNNCSGKHAGMLAGTKAIEADVDLYHKASHPMQVRVRRTVEDVCGLEADQVMWGIDGCNLPAPACPLRAIARMYASFADAANVLEEGTALSERTTSAGRVFNAMTHYSELVGGEGRFCTELMKTYQGTLIGKLGADGCYGIGIRRSQDDDGSVSAVKNGAIGIAVKIEDGNINILYSAVMEILDQLEVGTPTVRQQMADFYLRDIHNTVGVVTGHVSHLFRVRKVA